MKIKELHLRNIASIEKADIDFENGLKDGVTGDPASVFLICGDTGAGKSVILDGISMALYKNTPRLESVQNKQKNRFSTSDGESIQVHDIEQYTRLGISDKDECYSEVVFTGNDGIEYRARLTLGMTLGKKDKDTGERPFKHCPYKWEVKVGDGPYTKDSIADTILSAVGLSFPQFGRMAMLAQGQFAAFLTGDKSERESILEQLTNTEHFSSYGKAIKSLFDKAKKACNDIQIKYDTESLHALPEDQVVTLTAEKEGLEERKKELDGAIAEIETKERLVNNVTTGQGNLETADAAIKDLKEIIDGDKYKEKKALVADWDATATERQRLKDLRENRDRLSRAKEDQQKQKISFSVLASDLEARRGRLAGMGDPKKAVDEKQKEIDALTRKRADLNPSKINADLNALYRDKAALNNISTREDQIQKDKEAADALEKEINGSKEIFESKEKTLNSTQAALETASKKSEAAEKRFLTMRASVEDNLKELRVRLIREHAETCPLCGQSLHEMPVEEDFYKMLSPLEKEKEDAAEELREATKLRDAARDEFNSFKGALEQKVKTLDSKRKTTKADITALATDATHLGIDSAKPLSEQIESLLKKLDNQEAALTMRQAKAEDLQEQIGKSREEKVPLDEALQRYNKESMDIKTIEETYLKPVAAILTLSDAPAEPRPFNCANIKEEWKHLYEKVVATSNSINELGNKCGEYSDLLTDYYKESGKTEEDLDAIILKASEIDGDRKFVQGKDADLQSQNDARKRAKQSIKTALQELGVSAEKDVPDGQELKEKKDELQDQLNKDVLQRIGAISAQLKANSQNAETLAVLKKELDEAKARQTKWDILNKYFGGTRFRTLVQTYILRPLLNNANVYLKKITERYTLTCSEDNEQLSILVLDNYNKKQIRSVTVLSGGERFMISLALSLALSSLNRPDMNVNILFIDEGFGTLDEKSLDSVMATLEKLQEIAGESNRRVGIISHREELDERIPVQIQVKKRGEGRSTIEIINK